MNRHYAAVLRLSLCLLALLLAACRREAAQQLAISAPTLTPTPRSTPLPAVPTIIPPGSAENPLSMIIVRQPTLPDAASAAPDLQSALQERTGLVIQVQFVERQGEALAALCDSTAARASVAWVNGLALTAARALNCGQPALRVIGGTRTNPQAGQAAQIIANRSLRLNGVNALNRRSFCRLRGGDLYSWLAPSLLMRANGLDPLTAPTSVTDYDNLTALIGAVAAGDCDAAGIPAGALDELADELGDNVEKVEVLAATVDFPLAVLVYPLAVPLGVRLTLTETLLALAQDSQQAVTLRALLGQTALEKAEPDDFDALADFMAATGLDFAQLGG